MVKKYRLFWFSALTAFIFLPTPTLAQNNPENPKIDADMQVQLEEGALQQTETAIVRYQPGQKDYVRNLFLARGAVQVEDHEWVNAFTFRVSGVAIVELVTDPAILSISSSRGNQLSTFSPASPILRETLGGLPPRQYGGQGVTVAILDTGIHEGSSFEGRIRAFYDFTVTQTGGIQTTPYDDHGHGTHVAGLIGGIKIGDDYYGVAPAVNFVVLKVLDRNGQGQTHKVIEAIEFLLNNRVVLGVDVVNISFGHPPFHPRAKDPLIHAVERLVDAGMIVVCSAGNHGLPPLMTGEPPVPDTRPRDRHYFGGITVPGSSPRVLTVGSVRSQGTVPRLDDRVALYSSAGPTWFDGFSKPDLVAFGHSELSDIPPGSTLPTGYPEYVVGDRFMRLSGTSMAAAVMSGVVALAVESNRTGCEPGQGCPPFAQRPRLTANLMKAIAMFSAIPVYQDDGVPYHRLIQGAGAVNADGVMTLARLIDTTRPVGEVWLPSAVLPFSLIGGYHEPWSRAIMWGDRASSEADDPLRMHHAAFSAEVIWGDNIVWGDVLRMP